MGDAEKIVRALKTYYADLQCYLYKSEIDLIIQALQEKAEREKMVRCKNCKYLYIKDFVYGTCNNSKGISGIIQPDDFCSYGQLKEGI